jgi:hypothetical protein
MDAPDLRWHDRSTADSERYELHAWPTIRAVVTRLRTATTRADYQAFIELQGQATPVPRSFMTRRDAQEWAMRAIEQRLLGQSTRLA